jgi:hypothetical protein
MAATGYGGRTDVGSATIDFGALLHADNAEPINAR